MTREKAMASRLKVLVVTFTKVNGKTTSSTAKEHLSRTVERPSSVNGRMGTWMDQPRSLKTIKQPILLLFKEVRFQFQVLIL